MLSALVCLHHRLYFDQTITSSSEPYYTSPSNLSKVCVDSRLFLKTLENGVRRVRIAVVFKIYTS